MFERYAIYLTFDSAFGARGAEWLGWNLATGTECKHPILGDFDLAAITKRPRPYGFHATIKAPFRLTEEASEDALLSRFERYCATTKPVRTEGLEISQIGRFLALTLRSKDSAVRALAGEVVQTFDPFRAPLTQADIARRNPDRLPSAQRSNLMRWGYPHVMDAYKFHVTLTGPMNEPILEIVRGAAGNFFASVLPAPFGIAHLTLAGQKGDGMFYEISRAPLKG